MSSTLCLIFVVLLVCQTARGRECPCDDPNHCNAITKSKSSPEVFGFVRSWNNTMEYWNNFYWDKLTTIATLGITDDRLTCLAHSHGVRVLLTPSHISTADMLDEAKLDAWVAKEVQLAIDYFYDGFDIDYETTVRQGSSLATAITSMTRKLKEGLQAADAARGYMSFCLPYKINWYTRWYEHDLLAEYVDIFFIMAYDEHKFNSAYDQTKAGVVSFLNGGIPKEKLLVGLAWYGLHVWCRELFDQTQAETTHWLPCRALNWAQWDVVKLNRLELNQDVAVEKWDEDASCPYFYYKNPSNGRLNIGMTENYDSWIKKRRLVDEFDLIGFGIFPLSYVNYDDHEVMDAFRAAVYDP